MKPPTARGTRRISGYLLNRLGLDARNPAGRLRSLRLLGKNLSLIDPRQRPGLKESFGPVDENAGVTLFRQHMAVAGLQAEDLEKLAHAYQRNGILVISITGLALAGSLVSLYLGMGLLSFSLGVVIPVLLLLAFQNFLRARQIRDQRYLGGLEYLKLLCNKKSLAG